MLIPAIRICDCGEQHPEGEIVGTLSIDVYGMRPPFKWDLCPTLLERVLKTLATETAEEKRLRAAVAKMERANAGGVEAEADPEP